MAREVMRLALGPEDDPGESVERLRGADQRLLEFEKLALALGAAQRGIGILLDGSRLGGGLAGWHANPWGFGLVQPLDSWAGRNVQLRVSGALGLTCPNYIAKCTVLYRIICE